MTHAHRKQRNGSDNSKHPPVKDAAHYHVHEVVKSEWAQAVTPQGHQELRTFDFAIARHTQLRQNFHELNVDA